MSIVATVAAAATVLIAVGFSIFMIIEAFKK